MARGPAGAPRAGERRRQGGGGRCVGEALGSSCRAGWSEDSGVAVALLRSEGRIAACCSSISASATVSGDNYCFLFRVCISLATRASLSTESLSSPLPTPPLTARALSPFQRFMSELSALVANSCFGWLVGETEIREADVQVGRGQGGVGRQGCALQACGTRACGAGRHSWRGAAGGSRA